MTMHSRSKEQREAVRQLIYLVLTRDMATFNPDRFKHWIKETDSKFRKVGLMLKFEIRDRFVYFRIKEIRNGRPLLCWCRDEQYEKAVLPERSRLVRFHPVHRLQK